MLHVLCWIWCQIHSPTRAQHEFRRRAAAVTAIGPNRGSAGLVARWAWSCSRLERRPEKMYSFSKTSLHAQKAAALFAHGSMCQDSEARELECSPCVELAEASCSRWRVAGRAVGPKPTRGCFCPRPCENQAQHLAIVLSILREAKPKKSQLSMALHLVSTCGQGRWREGCRTNSSHRAAHSRRIQ